MAPRKPSGSTSKKQKAVTSSSQGSQEIDGTKFTGPVQFQRLTVPRLGSEETPLINDEYVDRHCKPKMKKRGVPSPAGPSALPSVQQPPAAPAPNFGIFYNYLSGNEEEAGSDAGSDASMDEGNEDFASD
ncbi:hypothetical protein P8452_09379 [Trifolium repens]|nr:hypothetical protein P8452_09379 [Trifolium repens]